MSPPPLSRRAVLGGLVAGAAAGAVPDAARAAEPPPAPRPARAPACFVGHGSPMTALDAAKGAIWTRWAEQSPKPVAVLVLSAHYERAPLTIGATTTVPLVYDMYGFPDALYRVTYPAPGAPRLADRVERLLAGRIPLRRDPSRGLDHGAWVPLRWLHPRADVPVLAVSLPSQDPSRLLALGRALAPLRDEGVQILGSGNVVHNLRELGRAAPGPPGPATPSWADEFDRWLADVLVRRDLDALADWERRAPAARRAHPTAEHLTPLFVVAGAGLDQGERLSFPVTGFEAGSISRRCVQIG